MSNGSAQPNEITIRLEIPADRGIGEAAEAIAQLLLNTNEARRNGDANPLVPFAITLHARPAVVDHEKVATALIAGLRDLPRFASPLEVRQFYTRQVQDVLPSGGVRGSDDDLAALADALIVARYHCDF